MTEVCRERGHLSRLAGAAPGTLAARKNLGHGGATRLRCRGRRDHWVRLGEQPQSLEGEVRVPVAVHDDLRDGLDAGAREEGLRGARGLASIRFVHVHDEAQAPAVGREDERTRVHVGTAPEGGPANAHLS